MSAKRSYLAAAFNARPFDMPVPPNWFGVAAFALLGAFVNPGWLKALAYLVAVVIASLNTWLLFQTFRGWVS